MPDDNVQSQKYPDTGIPRYFMKSSNSAKIQPCESQCCARYF